MFGKIQNKNESIYYFIASQIPKKTKTQKYKKTEEHFRIPPFEVTSGFEPL